MSIRTSRSWILACGAAVLCFPVGVCSAGGPQTSSKSEGANALRHAILERFDKNLDGRLDYKEKAAATRALLGRNETDEELNDLRQRILARFDKNGNGKLERSEIRAALASVNAKSPAAGRVKGSQSAEETATVSNRDRNAASTARDPSAAVNFVAQNLMSAGMDAETAQTVAFQKFDLNGDGVLDQAELALAQASLLQQLAQSSGTNSLPLSPTLTTSIGTTASTSTGTSTTGQSSSMAGGCSNGGSGSTGSSGTTTSSQIAGSTQGFGPQAANSQALGNANSAIARPGGFGGGRRR